MNEDMRDAEDRELAAAAFDADADADADEYAYEYAHEYALNDIGLALRLHALDE